MVYVFSKEVNIFGNSLMTVTENSTTQPKLLQTQWEKNAQK
jgi:hypothetical protein